MVIRKANGFLLELPGSYRRPVVDVLATQHRWVIVTVVDPHYDVGPIERFASPHVDSLEVARFPSAVQLSFRFRSEVIQAEVTSQPSDPSILISVFTR